MDKWKYSMFQPIEYCLCKTYINQEDQIRTKCEDIASKYWICQNEFKINQNYNISKEKQ